MIEHRVVRLTEKGNFEPAAIVGHEKPYFVGEEGFDRAMDLRDYLAGDHVVVSEPQTGYVIVRNKRHRRGLIITANAGTDTEHYIAYSYYGSGHDEIYLGSKTYKTTKGAAKKVYQYVN